MWADMCCVVLPFPKWYAYVLLKTYRFLGLHGQIQIYVHDQELIEWFSLNIVPTVKKLS